MWFWSDSKSSGPMGCVVIQGGGWGDNFILVADGYRVAPVPPPTKRDLCTPLMCNVGSAESWTLLSVWVSPLSSAVPLLPSLSFVIRFNVRWGLSTPALPFPHRNVLVLFRWGLVNETSELWSQTVWVQIQPLPGIRCVTLVSPFTFLFLEITICNCRNKIKLFS